MTAFTSNYTVICEALGAVNSKGVWNGDDPVSYMAPLLILQLSLITICIRVTAFFLQPLGLPMIISQIIGGVILGPTVLGRNKNISSKLFSPKGKVVLNTLSWFGLMVFFFVETVKVDLKIVKQSGRKAIAIGLSSLFLPLILCMTVALILKQHLPSDSHLVSSLPYWAIAQCLVPFIVVSCILTEQKTLNTDLGRLAVSSSVYPDLTGICATMISFCLATIDPSRPLLTPLWALLSSIGFVVVIVVLLRPIMIWLSSLMPAEGKPTEKGNMQVYVAFLIMLVTGFISLANGQNMVLGPFIFGLIVPDGPPLGLALVEKLETLVSALFVPGFFLMCGLHTDMSTIRPKAAGFLLLLAIIACFGRMMGVMLSSLYYKIPMRDGLVVGLMLNGRGIVELVIFKLMNEAKVFDEQEYAIAVISILLITAITAPILKLLHDPSQRYKTSNRRTIQHTKRNSELRMLVCIRKQENVPTMINLIEVTHATRENPTSIIVLNLVELVGRASPVVLSHNNNDNEPPIPSTLTNVGSSSINSNHNLNHLAAGISTRSSDQIFNAFQQYRLLNEDCINIQQFTAISNVAIMHNDVCQLACDKRASIIIIPFHKEWAIDGSVSSVNSGLRVMNRNILKKAPCSVGVLIDRGIMQGSLSVVTNRSSFYRVAVLLMGGGDDGEALAYGARIALHRHVKVTLIFFHDNSSKKSSRDAVNSNQHRIDHLNVMERYKLINEVNDRMEYREEVVTDGEKLAALIRAILDEGNDLTIVGRRQWRSSPLFLGLNEWNDCPELGVIGDMLTSPDFGTTSSILVVQQQRKLFQRRLSKGGGSIDVINHGGSKNHTTDFSIHDVQMNENDETTWRVTLDRMR